MTQDFTSLSGYFRRGTAFKIFRGNVFMEDSPVGVGFKYR